MSEQETYHVIEPVSIVLIKKGTDLLLAKGLPPKTYHSCVAGHVESNETAEECAHREVMEEVGVEIENLKYFGSQAWPHPNKLMIAFIADYKSGEIKIDPAEITHAAWFTKDNPPELPSENSISRRMIDSVWLYSGF